MMTITFVMMTMRNVIMTMTLVMMTTTFVRLTMTYVIMTMTYVMMKMMLVMITMTNVMMTLTYVMMTMTNVMITLTYVIMTLTLFLSTLSFAGTARKRVKPPKQLLTVNDGAASPVVHCTSTFERVSNQQVAGGGKQSLVLAAERRLTLAEATRGWGKWLFSLTERRRRGAQTEPLFVIKTHPWVTHFR